MKSRPTCSLPVYCLLTLLTAYCLTGCATIVSGKTQPLTFNSTPDGADVLINGMRVGTTPLTLDVRRQEALTITIKKDGFRESTLQPRTKSNPWLIGNLIWSWLSTTGTTVDYATDSNIEYTPDQFFTTLEPLEPERLGSFRPTLDLTRFVLHMYVPLQRDIMLGRGENLDSLFALLNLTATERPDALSTLKGLMRASPRPPDFVQALLTAFPPKARQG